MAVPVVSAFILIVTTSSVCHLPILEYAEVVRCLHSCSIMVFAPDQCSSNFDFSSFRTTPDKSLARYALLLTLFFVGLFSLISAYVLFSDSQYLVLIANFSSVRQRSQNSYQHSERSYIRDSFGTNQLSDFIPNRRILGCWTYGSWVD
jgi:hypothetical protein